MITLDGQFFSGVAAIITSLSALIWAIRRRR